MDQVIKPRGDSFRLKAHGVAWEYAGFSLEREEYLDEMWEKYKKDWSTYFLGGGNSNIFFMFTLYLGKIHSHFEEHIFQMA